METSGSFCLFIHLLAHDRHITPNICPMAQLDTEMAANLVVAVFQHMLLRVCSVCVCTCVRVHQTALVTMATFIKENLEGHTSWRLLIGREERSSMTLVVAVKTVMSLPSYI